MAEIWHNNGMSRVRVSTTVDAELLERARHYAGRSKDSAVLDLALAAYVGAQRSAEIDASYAAYDEHPLEEPDEWGSLAEFLDAVRTP
jgi:hypothetical protein